MDTTMFGDQAADALDGLLALPDDFEIAGVMIVVALDEPEGGGTTYRVYSSSDRSWEQEGLLRAGLRTVHEGETFEEGEEPPT